MSKYKLVVSDLDGTLLNSMHLVSERNAAAIRNIRAKGIRFVPATGRNYQSIEPLLNQIGTADADDEYLITCNGGMILADRGRRVLHLDEMPFDVASALYLHGLSQGVCTHVCTFSDEYVHNPGDVHQR